MKHLNDFNTHFKLLENLAQAKAILRNKSIDETDENYQKILQITNKDGYTGLIVRLVFKDGIELQEALDLYQDLKSNKVDVSKLTKLEYADILDIIYQEDEKDVQFIMEYNNYKVYYVKTYDSCLTISSPAWCLKTKNFWNKYTHTQKGTQFVLINKNAFKNNRLILSTPDNYYGDKYTNTSKPDIRYGLTIFPSGNILAFDDNNINAVNKDIIKNIKPILYQWMQDNNITSKNNIDISTYTNFKEELLEAISESGYDNSFDNGIYVKISTDLEKEINNVCNVMNITSDTLKEFFMNNKENILGDEDITMKNGFLDILLYHYYGKNEHDLSGIKLNERETDDQSYKYYYGFHKYYWSRKLIEQSYKSVSEWLYKIATLFPMFLGIDYDIGTIYVNEFYSDFEYYRKLTTNDVEKYYNVEKLDNGAVVYFNVKNFIKDNIKTNKEKFIDILIKNFNIKNYDNVMKIYFLDEYVRKEE